jgi:hypothetical protein
MGLPIFYNLIDTVLFMQISSSIGTSDNNGIEQAMKESGETLKL